MKITNVKKAGILFLAGILFASCANTYEAIGNVSVLSDRVVKPGLAYKQLTTQSGSTKKEIKHSKAQTVDEAVSQAISAVPGGCFITNVTIYIAADGRYAVSGNVWGTEAEDTVMHYPSMVASVHSK